jgi:hypothetical protein
MVYLLFRVYNRSSQRHRQFRSLRGRIEPVRSARIQSPARTSKRLFQWDPATFFGLGDTGCVERNADVRVQKLIILPQKALRQEHLIPRSSSRIRGERIMRWPRTQQDGFRAVLEQRRPILG